MGTNKKSKDDEDYIDVDDSGQPDQKEDKGGYSWEADFKRSWEDVEEDDKGSLKYLVQNLQLQLKRRRQTKDSSIVQRGILRHLFLIIDLSLCMSEKDLRPSRISITLAYLEQFILEFFDQNPISQLGIIVTKDGLATKLTELSGDINKHTEALKTKSNVILSGEPSLQNCLELARHSLNCLPAHASRELLIIFGSLTTSDPTDIGETISSLKSDGIRATVISLAAEVQVLKRLATATNGEYDVVFNESHFKDLLFKVTPPPTLPELNNTKVDCVLMGFPTRIEGQDSALCPCHGVPVASGYSCPRCKTKVCQLPNQCPICALTLIASPHLARSYHHLFPVQAFLPQPVNLGDSCSGCNQAFKVAPKPVESTKKSETVLDVSTEKYTCTQCNSDFCLECDLFVHETLHNCPGCCV